VWFGLLIVLLMSYWAIHVAGKVLRHASPPPSPVEEGADRPEPGRNADWAERFEKIREQREAEQSPPPALDRIPLPDLPRMDFKRNDRPPAPAVD